MPRIIVFDVNETLLDVDALKPHFARAFGDELVLREWFSTVLLYSEVASLAGPYSDFGAIGGAALDMTASQPSRVPVWRRIERRFSAACDHCPRILTCGRSEPATAGWLSAGDADELLPHRSWNSN